MIRNLMYLCFKRQHGTCEVDEIKNACRSEEGPEPSIFPYGKAQEELDQICEKCGERMFEIHKLVCPVCLGDVGPAHFVTEWEAASTKVYQYRCLQCDSLLFSYKKLE